MKGNKYYKIHQCNGIESPEINTYLPNIDWNLVGNNSEISN